MPRTSNAVTITNLDLLNIALKKFMHEVPHLEELRQELEAALEEIKRRRAAYMRLSARALSESKKMREAKERARQAESRIRASLKGAYGGKSEELIRYGIKPHRGMKRPAPETLLPEPELPEPEEE
jgi:hypothetical protein